MDTKALRQKILDLAIRGKLVPQDPNDEPASVLLERIHAEKQQMVKDGKLKPKDIKNDTVIFKGDDNLHYEKFSDGTVKCIEDELPFDVPEGWKWARLNDLALYKKGPFGSSITKAMFVPESDNAIKVYEQKNAINKNAHLGHYFISQEKYQELKGFEIFPGDIIVSCAGTIGETFVMPSDMRKGIINQALMKIHLYDNSIKDFYLMYFDNKLKSLANEQGYGMALKNIPPFSVLKQYLIPIPPMAEQEKIGNLGEDKEVFLRKEYKTFFDNETGFKFGQTATALKSILKYLRNINKKALEGVNEDIKQFNQEIKENNIQATDFIGIKKYFTNGKGEAYEPSDGERIMLILDRALFEDKEVYILDEPERSLGNNFINDVILPRINQLAKLKKTIIIATHNANIAVRTLPFVSILKEYAKGEYKTYIGNPFVNKLVNQDDETDFKSWKDESIRVLEGGNEAFYDREDVYESR